MGVLRLDLALAKLISKNMLKGGLSLVDGLVGWWVGGLVAMSSRRINRRINQNQKSLGLQLGLALMGLPGRVGRESQQLPRAANHFPLGSGLSRGWGRYRAGLRVWDRRR